MKHLLALTLTLFLLTACGKAQDNDLGGDGDLGNMAFSGTSWTSADCLPNNTPYRGTALSQRRSLVFKGKKFEIKHILYKTSDCNDHEVTLTQSATYSYKRLDDKSDFNNDIAEVTENIKEFSIKPATPAVAKALNDRKYCGIITWSKNSVIVTGRTCDRQNIYKKGPRFNLMNWNKDTSPETIALGFFTSTKNGKSADTRPTDVETVLHERNQGPTL